MLVMFIVLTRQWLHTRRHAQLFILNLSCCNKEDDNDNNNNNNNNNNLPPIKCIALTLEGTKVCQKAKQCNAMQCNAMQCNDVVACFYFGSKTATMLDLIIINQSEIQALSYIIKLSSPNDAYCTYCQQNKECEEASVWKFLCGKGSIEPDHLYGKVVLNLSLNFFVNN
uniref:Uncharacterized protein n=1 Tax=Glossina palpalis gambiensis TaxID=67801 RepID=A0A1B0AVQ4_9MUSC